MALLQSAYTSSLALIGIAVLVASYIVRLIRRSIVHRQYQQEHGCKPIPSSARVKIKDPILGLDSLYAMVKAGRERRFLNRNLERFDKFGNTHSVRTLRHHVIATREPENIKTVLSIKFADYSLGNRIETLGPLLGEGIFTSDGQAWAHSRSLVRPNFVKDQVANLAAFEALMQDFFALLPRDGSTVDLSRLFFDYTIDSATEFLFGTSTRSLKNRRVGHESELNDFASAFNYAQHYLSFRMRLGPFMRFHRDKKADDSIRVCKLMVDQFVEEAISFRQQDDVEKVQNPNSEKKHKYVFLHGLARQTSDRVRLRDELMNILLAGRDTTASLLSNMFCMLARHPRVWAKLRQEIVDTLDGRLPSYEELRNLKYLKYCLNESLRLHPVVPLNGRTAITDTHLPLGGGPDGKSPVFVPKGTHVAYSVWAMHRRKDLYGPDAEEFRPERWEHLRPGWEYLPFNGGPRICVGQQYALTEAAYVTVRLAQEFKGLDNRDPDAWVEGLTLTLSPLNGTLVSLTPA